MIVPVYPINFILLQLVYTSTFQMFEAKLSKSANLKKLIDVIKDLVTDAPIDCNEYGITLQVFRLASYVFNPYLVHGWRSRCFGFDEAGIRHVRNLQNRSIY